MKLDYQIQGVSKLIGQLNTMAVQSKKRDDGDVLVGYSQNYALHVHERDVYHETGTWKYLEKAYKEVYPSILHTIKEVYKKTGSVQKGLLISGLRIQRVSQDKYCPVDTGALKASAWTATEDDARSAALKAKQRGDKKKNKKK